jgi:hypothetical protein
VHLGEAAHAAGLLRAPNAAAQALVSGLSALTLDQHLAPGAWWRGLPAAAAFYNDQLVASIFVPAVMVRVAAVAELALRLAHASLNSLFSAKD